MISVFDLRMVFDANGKPVDGEIVFSHECDVTGTVRHFAIERIERDIANGSLVPNQMLCIPIDPVFATFAMRARGVERHRWERLTPRKIKTNPIIVAHMPGVAKDVKDTEHLIIDGIHRYTRAAFLGYKTLYAHELTTEQWEPYLVDVPEVLNEKTRRQFKDQARGIPIDSHIK